MFDHSHFHRHWGPAWEAGRHGPGWGRMPGPGGRRGPSWFDDFFGPPPRAERGGVRYLVLDAISTSARHGYEVIQAIEERSGRAYRPSPGVVYPTLQLLEEMGHAKVTEQNGRRVYAITEDGTRDLEEHRDEVTDFYARFDDEAWDRQAEDFGEVLRRAARLFKSFKRAARHGRLSSKGQKRIREVLDQAVQQIEAILNEEGGV